MNTLYLDLEVNPKEIDEFADFTTEFFDRYVAVSGDSLVYICTANLEHEIDMMYTAVRLFGLQYYLAEPDDCADSYYIPMEQMILWRNPLAQCNMWGTTAISTCLCGAESLLINDLLWQDLYCQATDFMYENELQTEIELSQIRPHWHSMVSQCHRTTKSGTFRPDKVI